MKKSLNQNLINLIEYYSLYNIDLILSNKPLKRNTNKVANLSGQTKLQKLEKLKNAIHLIKNCELKKKCN